ncbi:MAG: hypothetical protein IKN25_02820, partial [Spirochaetales bacterium]|nr:hypothetical protein [Spirochaetales bacterium]
MKQTFRFLLFIMLVGILSGCTVLSSGSSANNGGSDNNGGSAGGGDNKEKRTISRTAALNALYDNTTLGEVHLTFTDEQWNTLVSNSNKKVTATDGNGNTKSWTVYDKTLYSSCDFVYKKGDKT